jgi:hypothetical protein
LADCGYQAAPLIRGGRLVPVLVDRIARGAATGFVTFDRRYPPQRIVAFADFICKPVPEVPEFTPYPKRGTPTAGIRCWILSNERTSSSRCFAPQPIAFVSMSLLIDRSGSQSHGEREDR